MSYRSTGDASEVTRQFKTKKMENGSARSCKTVELGRECSTYHARAHTNTDVFLLLVDTRCIYWMLRDRGCFAPFCINHTLLKNYLDMLIQVTEVLLDRRGKQKKESNAYDTKCLNRRSSACAWGLNEPPCRGANSAHTLVKKSR